MSKDYLPIHVNPGRLAENAVSLRGLFSIAKMDRLKTSLQMPEGDVEVQIHFGVDQQGLRYIKGQMHTSLTLQCQRCMEALEHEIIADFAYGMVSNEEKAKKLPSHYDPIIVEDQDLNLQDVIEEELIISLPIVPLHASEHCKVQLPLVAADPELIGAAEKENPFKVIESLKVKRKE
jgi:uncharacterized protein